MSAARSQAVAIAVIIIAGVAAYANSLAGPFTFDDAGSILENSSIHHLWPPGPVLAPPFAGGQTVGGRPVLNLSLALNYAVSGTGVWSYHLFNVWVHVLAGLVLFGIVRRTIGAARPDGSPGDPDAATPLALAIALLWTVHPLQTEAVTYTIQRAESLMGLFYLLTLYGFIRAIEAGPDARWQAWFCFSAVCCAGMATKEVMVSAPVLIFLYDRTFVAGSFRRAWAERRGFHLALAATWLLLAALMVSTHNRGGSVGFGNGVPWWAYALTQFPAIGRYLALSVWPHPLVFDYGSVWIHRAGEVIPSAVVVLALLAATIWALLRPASRGLGARALGFAGAWFFLILAPTSSVVPGTTQMIVEHRMYLPLAAVLTALVLGLHAVLARVARRGPAVLATWAVCLPLASAAAVLTVRRNEIYRDDLALWQDTVAKRPQAARPRSYLGAVLLTKGHPAEAMEEFQEASRLEPGNPQAHNGQGSIYLKAGRLPEAIVQYEEAVRAAPGYAEAEFNHGLALLTADRATEAVAHERAALHFRPEYPDALNTLGNALFRLGRPAEAVAGYEQAVALKPDEPEYRNNLGIALAHADRLKDAVDQLREAVRLRPGDAGFRSNLERVQAVLDAGGHS